MYFNQWKKEILTIPNMLSLFRLALIPIYIMIYLNAAAPQEYLLAGTILGLSCLTDLIDGHIARQFHMVSNLGKILDPLADKMTQLALTVCLSVRYPILRWILLLFIVKEVFQTLAMIFMYHQGKVLPGALLPGKICTVVLFMSFITMIVFPQLNQQTVNAITVLDSAVLVYSFISYFLAYFGNNSKLQNLNE